MNRSINIHHNKINCGKQGQIRIKTPISKMDEDLEIEISGCPNEQLTLKLVTNDFYSINADIRIMDVGTVWKSSILVELDETGKAYLDARIFTTLKITARKKVL